jgi:hypothetical protein
MNNINIVDIAAVVGILVSFIAIFKFHVILKNGIYKLNEKIDHMHSKLDKKIKQVRYEIQKEL